MPRAVRVTINGNLYLVEEGAKITATDIRSRLLGKRGFRPLPGFDKATVYYHQFLKKTWKPIKRGVRIVFESGMAFQVLVKVKRKRGCKIGKGPHGGVAFLCRRGD